ncbi:MAG: beta-glucuronidase [Planctomycetota bacterium]|nr:MAG: beta-glucuronidase [Planctomycetota bacterium]
MFPVVSETRDCHSLDGIWKVAYVFDEDGPSDIGPDAIPAGCDEVAVPASLNEQSTDRRKYLHMGTVWYYRWLRIPPSWQGQRISLRFGSVNYRAEVFLNGSSLGSHETGYTPFAFDLANDIAVGREHLLAVRVDNRLSIDTIPQGNVPASAGGVAGWRVGNLPNVHYDFFPFTGIHRPVTLVATGPSRLDKTFWSCTRVADGRAEGSAQFYVSGPAEKIEARIEDLDASLSATVVDGVATLDFALEGVIPWQPGAAQLYRIDIRVIHNGQVVDHYPLDYGFRTVRIAGQQFLVNEQPVFLRGFGRHEDLAVIGKGENLPFMVKDYNLMRWIGANSFRTSHYPYSEEQMRMADRQGIMVIDETAANTISMNAVKDDPQARARLYQRHRDHCQALIERDYNYASVVAWSLGNECEMQRSLSQGYFNDLLRSCKPLDPTRPFTLVSMASGSVEGIADIEADECDFIGYNVYPSWYFDQGKPEVIQGWLEAHCQGLWEHFGKPIILAEFGADTVPGLHSEYSLMWTEEYQIEVLRRIITFAEQCPQCFGAHIWNLADFKVGQHTGRIVVNWKGVFTRDRSPKAAAHEVRLLWTGRKGMDDIPAFANSHTLGQARYT